MYKTKFAYLVDVRLVPELCLVVGEAISRLHDLILSVVHSTDSLSVTVVNSFISNKQHYLLIHHRYITCTRNPLCLKYVY
jgi:hypothetical protein